MWLEPTGIHHGRSTERGSQRSLPENARRWPHLPRCPAGKLGLHSEDSCVRQWGDSPAHTYTGITQHSPVNGPGLLQVAAGQGDLQMIKQIFWLLGYFVFSFCKSGLLDIQPCTSFMLPESNNLVSTVRTAEFLMTKVILRTCWVKIRARLVSYNVAWFVQSQDGILQYCKSFRSWRWQSQSLNNIAARLASFT